MQFARLMLGARPRQRLPRPPGIGDRHLLGGVRPLGGRHPLRGLAPVHPPRALPIARPNSGHGPVRRSPQATALGRLAWLRGLDWICASAVLGLSLLGVVLVWSATRPALLQAGADPHTYLNKQVFNLVIGMILMLVVTRLDYEQLRRYSPLAYVAALLGVVAVLSPLGSTVNGARSWIALPGGFQVEPSEFAKLGVVLVTARILGGGLNADRPPRARDIAAAAACAAPVIASVAAEPALGVTVLLLVLMLGVIVLSGIKLRWLAFLGGLAGAAAIAGWQMHLLKAYQLRRLAAFVNPSANPTGAGYSAMQAKIAVGSGGLLGQGLFHGQLVAGSFVPEQRTDFIFTVAGEELGFVGAVVIILLLGIVIARALLIAARAHDQFGMLLAAGIAIWFAVESFINIGMTLGIVPVTGLPLPFVSYGGSAMFADMIAIGVLNVIRRKHSEPRSARLSLRRSAADLLATGGGAPFRRNI